MFVELVDSRYVLFQLVLQQLVLRYRRTVFGYLWTLINPLLMMAIMAVVFSALFQVDLKTFSVFLFSAMIPWNFFSSVVTQSSTAFINNESLIKKIYLPKAIFPFSISLAALIDSFLSFFALFIIIISLSGNLSWSLFFLPVSFALVFVFAMGFGLVLSIATVFFRDLQYLINIAIQGLFFLTPILYKPESLAGKVAVLVEINPVTPFIALFRAPLIDGIVPSGAIVLQAVVISTLSMTAGLFIFIRYQKQIVFRL